MTKPRIPSSCPAGFRGRYTVVSGDTMFFIAQRFGISLDFLITANPHIANPNMIYPGDVLCVPGKGGGRIPSSCPAGFRDRYTVVSGDTMFLIAKHFRVSLEALLAANPHIMHPNMIFPGDVLCIPGRKTDHRHDYGHGHHDNNEHGYKHGHKGDYGYGHKEDYEDGCKGGNVPDSCPAGFEDLYTVQAGDTMFSIAQMFEVSLKALLAANPHITDPQVIFPGDVLCVPEEEGGRIPPSCPAGFEGLYKVQAGDTMFSIAQMFGVSMKSLLAANPHITDPQIIFPGDILCVPSRVPKSCPAGFRERYTVQAGDTMFSIAQMFGVRLEALLAANPHITDPQVIFPGDMLCVP